LFKENHWSIVVGLIDSSSIAREYLARGMQTRFQTNFNGENPAFKGVRYHVLKYESSKGYPEVERTMRQMSQISRSMIYNPERLTRTKYFSSYLLFLRFHSSLPVWLREIFDDGFGECNGWED
jgi:hypothetical protein